jgi:hypothetical protein
MTGKADHVSELNAERRRWPRVEGRHGLGLTVLAAPGLPAVEGRHYACQTEDLSAGGFRFRIETRLPLSTLLRMDVNLADVCGESFVHIGRVAWEQEIELDTQVTNWLGVEITETIGGEERALKWRAVIEDLWRGLLAPGT